MYALRKYLLSRGLICADPRGFFLFSEITLFQETCSSSVSCQHAVQKLKLLFDVNVPVKFVLNGIKNLFDVNKVANLQHIFGLLFSVV